MIRYRHCRSGVFAPTDWSTPEYARQVVERSATKPEAYLKLEHVYGYSGLGNTAPNLFFAGTGDVVYYTAAVGMLALGSIRCRPLEKILAHPLACGPCFVCRGRRAPAESSEMRGATSKRPFAESTAAFTSRSSDS
eukprot:SAG31_NODE_14887_length_782_cov_0.916545_2_plen_135_part_01